MSELTAALATIEKCRELTNCPAGVDLQDHLRQLAAERDTSLNAERVWEKSMMEACGEDGPASVTAVIKQLAAENVALGRSAECLLHEASEVYRAYNKTQLPDGDMVDGQSLQEVWDAINATPATNAYLAGIKADAQSEVIEWLDAEITAIDTMYRGDPSYERDANWMKSEVLDVVELARKAFSAQLREGADK